MCTIVGTALANIPDVQQSTFDDRLARSPVNCHPSNPLFEYTYSGTLRNAAGQPVANWPAADIELEISVQAGDDPCDNPVILNPAADSDANGVVTWTREVLNQGGGGCQAPGSVEITILSLNLVFKTLDRVTSTDYDGNGGIGLPDLGSLQEAVFSSGPCAVIDCLYKGDLNLDGAIGGGLVDLGFLQTSDSTNFPCP
jgi:hypothetical protein